jgi:uncharacterized membrane protein YphA (DoxX/SURF4 family)
MCAGLFKAFHCTETAAEVRHYHIPLARYLLPAMIMTALVGCVVVVGNIQVWAVALVWITFTIPKALLYDLPARVSGSIDFIRLNQFSRNPSIFGGLLALLLPKPAKPAWLCAFVTG